jgi:hypothetical protein
LNESRVRCHKTGRHVAHSCLRFIYVLHHLLPNLLLALSLLLLDLLLLMQLLLAL